MSDVEQDEYQLACSTAASTTPDARRIVISWYSGLLTILLNRLLGRCLPVADDAHLLARDMGDRWFAFAVSGVPDSPGRPEWPRYDPGDPQHMVFDRPHSDVRPCPRNPDST